MALSGITEKLKRPARPKSARAKPFKPAKGAKFIFFIGDEGAILVYLKGGAVQSRQFVSDSNEHSLTDLKDTLSSDLKAPIMMVIDTMDQSYIQQTLPPVSALSVKKLIKRRLDRDFGANDIKGAILLDREKDGRKDWNFLMVAIERNAHLAGWLNVISALPNRFQGIYLLSVETESIVKHLQAAMGAPSDVAKAEWVFFVSHNKVGGFRQVVLRNGRIIFTRMAQPIGESTPEVVSGNIEQEMLSTIEYMRRLSFNGQAGLDIYIIASDAVKTAFDRSKFQATSLEILTPFEVAEYMGIAGATQPTDQFGDVVLAAAIGSSRKHVLTLSTPEIVRFDALYNIMLFQRMAVALAALGMLGYAGSLGYDIFTSYSLQSELQERKESQQRMLQQLRDDLQKANIDVERTVDTIDMYKKLLEEKSDPLAFIVRIESAIKWPIRVKDIEWSLTDKAAPAPAASAAPPAAVPGKEPPISATLTLEFTGVSDIDALKSVANKALKDVKAAFQGYDVSYSQVPVGFSENEKLEVTFGNATEKPIGNDTGLEVKLSIKTAGAAAGAK